jgi:hypothetical protein
VGYQVIKQPDDKLAIWSSFTDDWAAIDCTPGEAVEFFVDFAAESARRNAERIVGQVVADERAYYQFTMTFDEAQERRREHHGDAPWPPPWATDV